MTKYVESAIQYCFDNPFVALDFLAVAITGLIVLAVERACAITEHAVPEHGSGDAHEEETEDE